MPSTSGRACCTSAARQVQLRPQSGLAHCAPAMGMLGRWCLCCAATTCRCQLWNCLQPAQQPHIEFDRGETRAGLSTSCECPIVSDPYMGLGTDRVRSCSVNSPDVHPEMSSGYPWRIWAEAGLGSLAHPWSLSGCPWRHGGSRRTPAPSGCAPHASLSGSS